MAFLEQNEETLFFVTSKGVFTFCRSGVPQVSSFFKFDAPCEPSVSANGSFQVLASSLQAEEALLAVATSDKCVRLYDVSAKTSKSCWKVNKQPTALAFAGNGSLLVADRAGEVTLLGSFESKPLLGHCSMLLDMVINKEKRFLVTADRDNKIRVSNYPNAYNIQCFCLGHTDYVRSLTWMQDSNEKDFLVSSSGDETIRIWDIVEGECLHVIQLRPLLESLKPDFAVKAAECRVFSAGRTLAVVYLHFVLILNLDPFQWSVKSDQCLRSDGEILDILFQDNDHLMFLQRLGSVALKMFKRLRTEEPFEEYTDDFSVIVNGDSKLRDALHESSYVQLPLRKLGSLADDGERESKRPRIDCDIYASRSRPP
ncbi:hypothetical protein M513_10030 [Trichuris suis]|uniref:tRNA (guanine-N(7)-)-methyltransferase non-catalytic subunit n=1 Tax=Trichuris suis TaxID=68888 RepID=A0A085LVU2_9BILA|nr:hypothetical protein M513_10030 [Trichuris suis]